jgi:hypothetical protein
MKSFSLLLSLVAVAAALPSARNPFVLNGLSESYIADDAVWQSVNLDPSALRLVQFEGWDPVWITEAEKVCSLSPSVRLAGVSYCSQIHAKQQSIPFMDMCVTPTRASITFTPCLTPHFCSTDTQDLGSSVAFKSRVKRASVERLPHTHTTLNVDSSGLSDCAQCHETGQGRHQDSDHGWYEREPQEVL